MTEAELTRKELKRIKARWPDCFRWKINERISTGIPDALLVNGAGTHSTVWLEFKRPTRMTQDPLTMVTPLQFDNLRRLSGHGHSCYIVAFMPDGTQRLYLVQRFLTAPIAFDGLMPLLETLWTT